MRPALLLLLAFVACDRADPAANTAVGTLEMVEIDVGPLQPARAVRIAVREGDVVRAGDTLAVFALPTLAASEAQADARLAAARQGARELERGSRPAEIARAESDLRGAEADVELAAAELARVEALVAAGGASRQQGDAARTRARVTAARRDALRESLRLLREGARVEQRQAAAAEARAAAAGAAAIRASASDLVLLAPVDGLVTSRNAEPGEVLASGASAVTLGQPARPWARVYVSQETLARLRVGDSLDAVLDGDTTRHRGRVASVATRAEFTPRVALTETERADLLFGVRIEFADTTGRLKAGLPITVRLPAARP